MLNQINKITNSKLSIITFAISIITFYKDMNEITENFIQNLPIIITALFVMTILFLIHLFQRKGDGRMKNNNEKISALDNSTDVKNQNYKESIIKIIFKFIVLIIVSLSVITLLSINHLRNLDIYYIKVDNYSSLKKSVNAKSKLTALFKSKGINSKLFIKKRSSKNIENPYLLCINGGYINRKKAEVDSLDIQNKLGNQLKISIPPPTKNISVRKKIYYLVNRFNWLN